MRPPNRCRAPGLNRRSLCLVMAFAVLASIAIVETPTSMAAQPPTMNEPVGVHARAGYPGGPSAHPGSNRVFGSLMRRNLPTNNAARGNQSGGITTDNFIVFAEDPAFAKLVAREAERYRRELAIEWLGRELPRWPERCPIKVELQPHAGGETSFAFLMDETGRGEPTSWDMKIFGPHDRLVDAVLPHEITHTIFASHFRRPLPRWADEGACTTVEHETEKKKNHGMLINFLSASPSRGIPFNRMFTMRNYPRDILPLYAQGYSVAKFLIMQKGRRHFLDYIESGMNRERPGSELAAWDAATEDYYGFGNLSDLQVAWIGWVRGGSVIETPNTVSPDATQTPPTALASIRRPTREPAPAAAKTEPVTREIPKANTEPSNQGWYAREMKIRAAAKPAGTGLMATSPEKEPTTIWR